MENESIFENANTNANAIANANVSDTKEYSNPELMRIRTTIENMSKFNQIEVLRLLYNNYKEDVVFNENNYGIHINLSDLKNEIIEQLDLYINYVKTQENNLSNIEQKKEALQNIYFCKDNKDNVMNNVIV
jgi:hypothetical protein